MNSNHAPAAGYLFIHPLLEPDEKWGGYLVELTPGSRQPALLDRLYQAEAVDRFDRRHLWLLPAEADCAVTPERFGTVAYYFPAGDDGAQAAFAAELRRQRRYQLGLASAPGTPLPAAGTWDTLLIASSHARSLPPYTLLGQASRTTVVGTDVHCHADRNWLIENGCTLTTGEYALIRASDGRKADSTRFKLLELLSLAAEDADTAALEAVFKQEPKLSYSLLRLVNSAAVSPRTPITSFAQAINLLGRRQLQRWLQLLVYADPNNGNNPNPLLLSAAARGHLMEKLACSLSPAPAIDNLADAAFMVGTFSLLDVLLNTSMPSVLQQLPLARPVQQALAEHEGPLGQLLQALRHADEHGLKEASLGLGALGIQPESFVDAQLTALLWAANIRPPSA